MGYVVGGGGDGHFQRWEEVLMVSRSSNYKVNKVTKFDEVGYRGLRLASFNTKTFFLVQFWQNYDLVFVLPNNMTDVMIKN